MGLFVRDDNYDESVRMTGFNRYKQLLSFYAGHWLKLNLILFLLPLIAGITFSILTTSLLYLIPASLIGGAIAGPQFAALIDSIMRGLRDDSGMRMDNYKKALRQNAKCSLLPGALLGLIIGIYSFYLYILLYTDTLVMSKGTIALIIVGLVIIINFELLYWPQMVLFKALQG